MKKAIRIISTLMCLVLIQACETKDQPLCEDPLGCVRIGETETIKIGALQVLSGGLKKSGMTHVRAIKLAAENRNHTIKGHAIEIIEQDSECSVEAGINGAISLTIQPDLIGIIGTYCSGAAIGASPIVSSAGMVMISGVNSSPSLTASGGKFAKNWYPGYYRTTYNGAKMAEMAAEFVIKSLAIKQAATMHDGDDFTKGLTTVFEDRFRDLGGEIVTTIEIAKGDEDMKPALEAITYAKAKLVYFPLFQPEAEAVIKTSRQIKAFGQIKLIASGGIASESFIKNIKSDGIGLYLTSVDPLESPELDALVQQYRTLFKEKPFHFTFPYVYDAARILLSAIETVAMETSGGELMIERQKLRDYLDNLSHFEGITGDLSNNGFGDFFSNSFSIVQLENPSHGLTGLKDNIKYTYR